MVWIVTYELKSVKDEFRVVAKDFEEACKKALLSKNGVGMNVKLLEIKVMDS